MNDIGSIILYCCITFVVTAIIVGLIFFKIGIAYRKKVAETEIGNAEEQALKIINDAHKNAKAKEKEIVVEAKEEIHRMRAEADKDIKDRRSEVTRQERRIQQKEETLDRKIDNLEKKEEIIQQKHQAAEEQLAEAEKIKKSQIDQLERISGLTASQAKDQLLDALESELAHEKALKISNYEQQLKDEAEDKARDLLSLAISRCSADHVSEATVSVVNLPNDGRFRRCCQRI